MTKEVDITMGPLIFLGKAADCGVEWSTSPPTSVMWGIGLAMGLSLTLATTVLGLLRRYHTASCPMICPVSASQ